MVAAGSDFKIFLSVVGKDAVGVTTEDVLAFIRGERSVGDPKVIRVVDGESGLSARKMKRRLSSVSSRLMLKTS